MNEFIFILPAMVACLILIGIHTYLGLQVIAREVIFLDIALAQIAALGLTLALLFGFDPDSQIAYVFALAMTFAAAILFTVMRTQKIPLEAVIGVTFVVSSAVGILLADQIPHGAEHIKYVLSGNILWVTWPQILKTALIYAVIGGIYYQWRKPIWIASSQKNPDSPNKKYYLIDLFFYLSFAVVITSSVQMAGVLLVFSFLIIPALCGLVVFSDSKRQLFWGWGMGSLASIMGLLASLYLDLPSGPSIVTALGIVLMLTFVSRRLLR